MFIRTHLGDEGLTLRLPGDRESLLAAMLTAGGGRARRALGRLLAAPPAAAAAARGEVRPDLDHRRPAEWIVRLLLSFAVMPSAVVDLDDADAVRAFVRDHVVRGFA